MRKTNSFQDTAETGRVVIDLGDGTTLETHTLVTRDTGWRVMPAFTGNAADETRPGEWRLRRVGDQVMIQMVGVGVKGTSIDFLGPNALPTGFSMAANVARLFETGTQHSTGVAVSTLGPTHRILVSDNDIVWRGWITATTNAFSTTAPTDHTGLMHAEASWTTDDAWPSTLPGTAA